MDFSAKHLGRSRLARRIGMERFRESLSEYFNFLELSLLKNNFIYLELRGLCVGEVQRLKDIDDERHQVFHDILVVPAQGIWGHVISCQTY